MRKKTQNKRRNDFISFQQRILEDAHGIDRVTSGICVTSVLHELGGSIDNVGSKKIKKFRRKFPKIYDLLMILFYIQGAKSRK